MIAFWKIVLNLLCLECSMVMEGRMSANF